MSNIKQLQKKQIGKETSWGTAVAQTIILAGVEELTLADGFEVIGNKEIGSLAPNQRGGAIVAVMGSASMKQRASFDHVGLIFDSLFGTATPSGVGPYTRTYNAPRTAQPTRSFFTLHNSYNGLAGHSLLGALASSLTMTIEAKQYVMLDVGFVGRNQAQDTTDSLSESSVAWMLAHNTTLSLGTYGGSLSALDCKVKRVEFIFNSNTKVNHGISSIEGCDYNYGDVECKLKFVAETNDSATLAIVNAMMGPTPTLVKREAQIVVDDGTYSLDLDFSGMLATPPSLYTDIDGVSTFELEFDADFDSSTNLTSYVDIELINNVASY